MKKLLIVLGTVAALHYNLQAAQASLSDRQAMFVTVCSMLSTGFCSEVTSMAAGKLCKEMLNQIKKDSSDNISRSICLATMLTVTGIVWGKFFGKIYNYLYKEIAEENYVDYFKDSIDQGNDPHEVLAGSIPQIKWVTKSQFEQILTVTSLNSKISLKPNNVYLNETLIAAACSGRDDLVPLLCNIGARDKDGKLAQMVQDRIQINNEAFILKEMNEKQLVVMDRLEKMKRALEKARS